MNLALLKNGAIFRKTCKKICGKNKLFRSEITLSTPEHKQHAPWKLFKNDYHFLEVSLSEFCHDCQILFCYS